MILVSLAEAKAVDNHHKPIDEGLKLGDRRWLDTVVVPTINDTNRESDVETIFILRNKLILSDLMRNLEFLGSGGSIVARPKLKGIDGKALPEVDFAVWSNRTAIVGTKSVGLCLCQLVDPRRFRGESWAARRPGTRKPKGDDDAVYHTTYGDLVARFSRVTLKNPS